MALSIQERLGISSEPIEGAAWQWACRLHSAIVGIVKSFDPVKQVCVVQPVIQEVVLKPPVGNNPNPGTTQNVPTQHTLDPIEDVPIMMMRVPGWSLTFPIVEGTECLLIAADNCIDGWWQSGGVQANFAMKRRHSLSDCMALFGPWSQPNNIPSYATDAVQLRSDDLSVMVELKTGEVNIKAAAITAKDAGTPQNLVNDTFYQWFVTNVVPFLVSKGYSGPSVPAGSETSVFKAE